MGSAPPDASALNDSLRRVHRSVLATLAACALVAAFGGAPPSDDASRPPSPVFSYAALGLAAFAVLARRIGPAGPARPRSYVFRTLASLVAAAGLGVVGAALAVSEGERQTGLLYVLAGAILSIRPPAPIPPRGSDA